MTALLLGDKNVDLVRFWMNCVYKAFKTHKDQAQIALWEKYSENIEAQIMLWYIS